MPRFTGGTENGQRTSTKKEGKRKLPNIGIKELFRELGAIPTGLARLGTSLAPGGQKSMLPEFGKGVASSFISTASNAALLPERAVTAVTGGERTAAKALGDFTEKHLGQRSGDYLTRAGERGLLAPAVEDIGNAALFAGGAAAAVGKVGATGKVARAGNLAEKAAAATPRTAARATTKATKAASKTADLVTDPARVASRQRLYTALDKGAHPYVTAYSKGVRPLTRASKAARLGEGAPAGPFGPAAPHDPTVPEYLGANQGPAEQAARQAAQAPIPEWAAKLADRVPEAIQKPLAAVERRLEAVDARAVYNERRRFVQASRRAAMKSPAVEASVTVAAQLIEGSRAAGKLIGRDEASAMIGSEITRRVSGVKALSDSLKGAHSQAALAEIGAVTDPIPAELLTPELDAAIEVATRAWTAAADARLTALTGGRKGAKGLSDEVKRSKAEERMVRQLTVDQRRLEKLEPRKAKEAERARKIITRADDIMARRIEEIDALRKSRGEALTAFDESRMPPAVPRNPQGWEPFVTDTIENGGGTFDPRTGAVVPKAYGGDAAGWASSVFDVDTIPTAAWATINPATGFSHGAEALHQVAVDFAEFLAENPDVRIGTWDHEGQVYIDFSQHTLHGRPMSRDEAMLLGTVREQKAIMDFETGVEVHPAGRPDVASQFVSRTLANKRTARQARASEYRLAVEKGIATHEQVDALMAALDSAAVLMQQNGKVSHADDAYRTFKVGYKQLAGAIKDNPVALLQAVLPKRSMREIYDEARKSIGNADDLEQWYFKSHEGIEQRWAGKEVTLLNGEKIGATELLYQLTAMSAIQVEPGVNLGHALAAARNMVEFHKEMAGKVGEAERLVGEFIKTEGKFRTNSELADHLLKGSHGLPLAKEYMLDILSGNTIDKLTPDYIARHVDLFGRKEKKLLQDKVPAHVVEALGGDAEKAFIEYYGGAARAKLQSFYDNLRDPANSRAVTLDQWMARLFEDADPRFLNKKGEPISSPWNQPGLYHEYAEKFRKFADDLSQEIGVEVKPHAIQALFWAYAKHEWTRIKKAGGDLLPHHEAISLRSYDFEDVLISPSERTGRLMEEFTAALGEVRADGPKEGFIRMYRGEPDTGAAAGSMFSDRLRYAENFAGEDGRVLQVDVPEAVAAAAGAEAAARGDVGFDLPYEWVDQASALSREPASFGDALLQKFGDDIRGALLIPQDGSPMAMQLFKTADFGTLVHENGHLLRQNLPAKQLKIIEAAYGLTDGVWTRAAEERFADDFVGYLGEGTPPKSPHMAGVFNTLRTGLGEQWRHLRGLLKNDLSPEAQGLFDELLDPPDQGFADLGIPGLRDAELSLRQRLQIAPKNMPETPGQMYRRGARGGQSLAEYERLGREISRKQGAIMKARKTQVDVQRILAEHALPSEIQAAALTARSERRMNALSRSLDDPTVARVPAAWKPLYGAVVGLSEAASKNPSLAAELEHMPRTMSEVMGFAAKEGFNPVHVRSFTPGEVEQLVFEGIRLGKKGRELGKAIEAGTRKQRVGAFARQQSIDALVAAQVEVAHERNTNALVDYLEDVVARPIPDDRIIPKGWVAWDAERSFILTGERTPDGGVMAGEAAGPKSMVPAEVRRTIGAYEKDYSHWAIRAVGKVTNPWRALVLTWTPRWYVNNFIGNMVLASTEGVRMQDWVRAWESYRKGFKDAPGVTGASMASGLGPKTLIPRARGVRQGVAQAAAEGGIEGGKVGSVRAVGSEVSQRVRRANEVVDELARAAVYFTGQRKGLTPEAALQRSFTALVDFGDLTPFEQSIVRAVVPFYSWQKGILKLTAKMPIEHPAAAGVLMELGRLNQRWAEENDLPEAYASLINTPGGSVNLRAFNPFQDAAQLTSPEGIAASINPFVEIGVRNAMGSPDGGFVEGYRLNEFGVAVPDTSPASDLGELAANLPQARLGGSLTGTGPDTAPGPGQGTLRFLGAPTYDDEQVARIQARVRKQRKRVK